MDLFYFIYLCLVLSPLIPTIRAGFSQLSEFIMTRSSISFTLVKSSVPEAFRASRGPHSGWPFRLDSGDLAGEIV